MTQKNTTPQDESMDDQLNAQGAVALKKQCEENLNGWKCALADYENYRREVMTRTAEMKEYHLMQITADILPVVDTLREALTHIPPEHHEAPWYQGLMQVGKQWELLKKNLGKRKEKRDGEKLEPGPPEGVRQKKKKIKKTRGDSDRPTT